MLQSEDGGDLSGFMPNGNHHHHHPSLSIHHHNYPYHHQHCSNLRWVEYAWYAGKTEFNCLWICWTGTLHRHHILYQHKVTIHSSVDKLLRKKKGVKSMEIIGIFWRQQTLYNFFNLILSAGSFLKSVQYKQAADVILLLQPDRALCLDLLYGPARLHPPTWCWRETHSRSSTLLFLYLVRICIRDFVNHESVLSTEGALRLPTT